MAFPISLDLRIPSSVMNPVINQVKLEMPYVKNMDGCFEER